MFFNRFSLFILFAVSLLSFVVWFATIEKAEVPPPAGKGMNHRGLKRKRKQKSSRPLRFSLCTLFPYPCSIFEIPFINDSLDLLMPTVRTTLIIFSFIRGAQPSAIWWSDYFKLFIIIVVILNLQVFRRVAYFS